MLSSRNKYLPIRRFTDLSTSSGRQLDDSGVSFKQKLSQYRSSKTPRYQRISSLFHKNRFSETSENNKDNSLGIYKTENNKKLQTRKNCTFEYKSVSMLSGKKNNLTTAKKQSQKKRFRTQFQTREHQLYSSIQNNLTQCDKILSKLKKVTQGDNKSSTQINQRIYQESKRYKNKESKSLRSEMQQAKSKLRITDTTFQQSLYPIIPTFSLNDCSKNFFIKQQLIKQPQRLYKSYEESLIDLRRKRIQQIMKCKKVNRLDQSMYRLKAREQNILSKMIQNRQQSILDINILQW